MVEELRGTGLSFEYEGGTPVVDAMDVSVAAGELVCVLGPNGAGKTTLLKLLSGLLSPASGQVTLEGTAIDAFSDRERAGHIATVPQYLPVIPDLTVADFVLSGRYVHFGAFSRPAGSDRDAVHECLARTGVEELGERCLWQISGGQRQRVIIARALAQGARYLLVDEPTGSLDPDQQLLIFSLLAELRSAGKALLVVTHELNLASQFASRIVLMQNGSIAAEGTPSEVLRPESLHAVYGSNLHIGSLPGPGGVGERPFVLPWILESGSGSDRDAE